MKTFKNNKALASESELSSVKIEFFYAKTNKPEDFVNEIENLCKRYCDIKDYFFKYSVED